ncbi:alpha/beta hydrolase [Sphingobacterium oryzagri]|uniref:Alpha/beta hydrolase n=1 Tax=Sphingobacterium oryzagri TaxID=3025669 RepID=A0ABY7WD74_9SPHI|nr:alpha/beta hydrolase [Sphingobacterium sp. KACC 22765]WDF67606.1 alpha/beta hydrolase [Sphingobacterium sp. KACC 22765]
MSFLFSFSKAFSQADSAAYNFESHIDLTYKVSAKNDSLKLDLFLPSSVAQEKKPLVILLHGGGWAFGDKELESIYFMRALKAQLLQNNYAVASIDYSLVSDSVHFPTPIADCKDAVKWLYSQADTYQLDTANFGIWGGSAGAHLAMLVAYSDADEFVGDKQLAAYPSRLNYVVDNFGPTDLNKLFKVNLNGVSTLMFKLFVRKLYDIRNNLTYAMTGYRFKDEKDKVIAANASYSPLQYIDENAAPTLILHGTKDRIVALEQSEALSKVLDQYQVANELVIVEGGDHGFGNIGNDKTDELVSKTVAYIKQHTH